MLRFQDIGQRGQIKLKFKQQQNKIVGPSEDSGRDKSVLQGQKGQQEKVERIPAKVVIFKKLAKRVKTKEQKVAKKSETARQQQQEVSFGSGVEAALTLQGSRQAWAVSSWLDLDLTSFCCCYSLQTGFSGV